MSRRAAAWTLGISLVLALLWMLLSPQLPLAEPYRSLFREGGTALACAVGAAALCMVAREPLLGREREGTGPFTIPAIAVILLVGVNNFPFLSILFGEARVTAPLPAVLLFAVLCLAVATFEELLFRGLLLPALCSRLPATPWGRCRAILAASAVFALSHLANLASGASLPATLLQVGYSFLVGCAASVLFLQGGGILLAIAFHAVYNFGGLLVPRLGEGRLWDTPTVVFTVLLALLATVLACLSLFWGQKRRKIPPK
ncbi:MAG: CPBP family intramembrane metalloprotease [Clostridia bacterium]|nr:CPBP family intramembrane metalloprotease [Clostridia bacterium]